MLMYLGMSVLDLDTFRFVNCSMRRFIFAHLYLLFTFFSFLIISSLLSVLSSLIKSLIIEFESLTCAIEDERWFEVWRWLYAGVWLIFDFMESVLFRLRDESVWGVKCCVNIWPNGLLMTFNETVHNTVNFALCLPILQSFCIYFLVDAPELSRCISIWITQFGITAALCTVLLGYRSMLTGWWPCTLSSFRLTWLLISCQWL